MELVIREAQSSIRSQSHRTEGKPCFHCQQQGHWARDCPYKSPNGKPLSVDSSDFPHIQCRCGAGTCVIRTSRTPRNPGRKFFSCPAKMGRNCDFFKWCDTVTDHEISKSPQSPPPPSSIPMCPCGAGTCGISMETIGPNAGRRSFVCPVKKGQGACNFFQWEDAQVNTEVNDVDETKQCSPHQSTGIGQQDTETEKSCSLKEGTLGFQHLERVEDSPVKENSCPSNPEAVSGPSEKHNVLLIENGGHDEASKFHSLKLHNTDAVVSLEGGHDEASKFHSLKLHNTDSVISLEDLVHQMLHLNVLGWLGRLAFPPSRCLTVPPPKPLLCCVFPSYDPILVPMDVKRDVECSNNLSQSPSDLLQLTPGQDAQILDVLLEPSGLENPPSILGGNAVISGSIMAAFQQAALHVQNELLTLLESMDPLDHKSMVQEANSAFAGLDRLGIDYRPFYERVKKFIGCASTLAQIESTIRNDLSSQELMDSYRSKMSHYENISRVHSKAMAAFTSSDDRLHFLQKEAIRVKEMLLQIETQLSCCEVETAVLEIHLLQISQDMLETKQNLEGVYKEAGQAIQLQQQRESERSAAKEAMERARAELRQ